VKRQRGAVAAAALIVLMLAGLGLYSYSTGYRMGSDLARHEHRN
jgi:hypothetical protein